MNIDLSSIWKTVVSATQSSTSSDKSLSSSTLTSLANSIISNIQAKTASKTSSTGNIDFIGIATQLMSLYNQYKSSKNTDEKAAATNVKGISDIIGAMGGDKSSIINTASSVLGKLFGK